jgi:polysaccharide export outer membrane protein
VSPLPAINREQRTIKSVRRCRPNTPDMKSILLLLTAFSAIAAAQQSGRVILPSFNGDNLPQQKIGPDDLIGISVYDSPELTRTVRVGADGSFRLPMLKQRITASGLLPADLEIAIGDALRKEDIFVDPIVTVSIVEYRSRPINVAGAVKRPLTFQATGSITLLDALARAEGLSELAGSEILVSRSQIGESGTPVMLTRRIPVKSLIDGADPELNLKLEGGEEIRVPEAGRVYVVGNIKKPGAFPIKDATDTTVLKALALSEGLMPFATKLAYIYRQEGGAAGKSEIPIELEKIMQRKSPDVLLLANDILYIPDSKSRRNVANALEKIVMVGGGMAAASIYMLR